MDLNMLSFANIFSKMSSQGFRSHWIEYLSINNAQVKQTGLEEYRTAFVFFLHATVSLSEMLTVLDCLLKRGDYGYDTNDAEMNEEGCWFPENDDYNKIPLSQIMFKYGDNVDYVSDQELKQIILIVCDICLGIFNEYKYPISTPERSKLAEIIKKAQEL
jgi:hypothetical protein